MPMIRLQNDKSAPAVTHAASIAALAAFISTGACLCILGNASAQSPAVGQPTVSAASAPTALAGPYRNWLDEDVRWIIASNERSAYSDLETNPERLQFIKAFWERRNPNPGSGENTFKEEHYRRLAYANQRFAIVGPGWMSDRGRIYIVHGKPGSIDAHPSGGMGEAAPFEVWHYNGIPINSPQAGDIELGSAMHSVDFRFVDRCHCGDYKLTTPLP